MMIKRPIEEAIGEPLLHDLTGVDACGVKGPAFKRGHVITEDDLPRLRAIGKNSVFVGELPPDAIHEEDAAVRLAEALLGDESISATAPSEGKISLLSQTDGLLCIDETTLNAMNRVTDVTIATRTNLIPVRSGETVAGVRIIPLYTAVDYIDQAVAYAEDARPVMRIMPFATKKVGVIITGTEIYEGLIEDRFESVLRDKFTSYPIDSLGFTLCPDDLGAILSAYGQFKDQGADIVLFTGGMSVDPDDLTPTAMKHLASEWITQGVPIQPGNMLTIARDDRTYLVGVPGASLHAPVTSFDFFFPWMLADYPFNREDLIRYGVGGLL